MQPLIDMIKSGEIAELRYKGIMLAGDLLRNQYTKYIFLGACALLFVVPTAAWVMAGPKEKVVAKASTLPPVHQAVLDDQVDKLERLVIDEFMDVDEILDNGMTPLTMSIDMSRTPVFHELIRLEADVNLRVNNQYYNNWTPLHFAAMHGNETMIRKLIKEGADLSAKTLEGVSPIELAEACDQDRAVALITELLVEKEEKRRSFVYRQ